MDYLLSRHPIFKSKVDLAGYEIRSRAVGEKSVGTLEAERSMFSMLSEGLDQIVGQHPCFISLTPQALAEGLWKAIPADKLVVGYFDDFGPADEVAQELLKLTGVGSRIALSGQLNPDSLNLFVDRAPVLKLDVTSIAPDDLEKRFIDLRRHKCPLLADCVDTWDDLEYCQSLGFDLYQGRFIARSAAHEEKQIPVNRLTMMRVLSQLQDPELELADLEKTISLDAALSYKLLTYANSAAVALPRKVNSVGHAMRLIGVQMLRTWTSVLLLSTIDDKPRELMTISLVRARMCERLSDSLKNAQKESFFSAGLLSVLDALLDCPMDKAVGELPLTDEVKSALINKAGPVGQALRCTMAYENADWDNVQFYGMSPAPIREIYMESIAWARQLSAGLLS
jgi:EAL and modified HD-GYP domain-containing signal transduction protein